VKWRKLRCRLCSKRYRACECFAVRDEQALAEAAERARAAYSRELYEKRQRALELALAKVRAA
jgi:hypothetical protein